MYERARNILTANPGIGKKTLALQLGVTTAFARRLRERWRGETQGHAPDADYQRVLALKTRHPSWGYRRLANALNMTENKAILLLARHQGACTHTPALPTIPPATQTVSVTATSPVPQAPPTPPPQPPPASPAPPSMPPRADTEPGDQGGAELHDSVHKSHRDLSYLGCNVRTLDELMVFAEVDLAVWEVERYMINRWEVGAKNPSTGEVLTSPLYQIKCWLRRRTSELDLKKVLADMLESFKVHAPERPVPASSMAPASGMLEVSLMDLHLGKLAWAPETGRDYDPDISEAMFRTALEDLLAKAAGCRPERILFPVGNDFFNTDSLAKTTTGGTPQEEGPRYHQSFIRGRQLLIWAIERLRQVAPVQVVAVAGNHDQQRLFYLGEVLHAWFSRTKDVTVDNGPSQRKYVHYGRCLLGFTHGNHERHTNLPLLMAKEQPQSWAASVHYEWHLGHWHIKQHKVFLPIRDEQGVMVRIIPSLCPPDAWHASMGYTGRLAAEAYYWHPQDGCVATFTHSPM